LLIAVAGLVGSGCNFDNPAGPADAVVGTPDAAAAGLDAGAVVPDAARAELDASAAISLIVQGAPNLPFNGTTTLVTVGFVTGTPTKVKLSRDGNSAFAEWPPNGFFTLDPSGRWLTGSWCISADCWGYQDGPHVLDAVATYADGQSASASVNLQVADSASDAGTSAGLDATSPDAAGLDAASPDAGTVLDAAVTGPLHMGVQGFAQAAGVTGGYGGVSMVVTNLDDVGAGSLRDALQASGPRYVTFTPGLAGTIHWGNVAYVESDDLTVDGRGARVTISGYSLNIFKGDSTRVRNVIVHDLTFADTETERNAVIIDHGSRDVWIDHCTFRNNSTGVNGQGLSLRTQDPGAGGNTGITLSWNHFMAPNIKSILISSSDSEVEGRVMRISLHHNWFDAVDARNPRIALATVHMWNNYVSNWVEYGVAAAFEAELYAQNNILEDSANQNGILDSYGGATANSVEASGNLLLGSPPPVIYTHGTFPMDRITYSVTPEAADLGLRDRIVAGAGAAP
jgi:pectate lyase